MLRRNYKRPIHLEPSRINNYNKLLCSLDNLSYKRENLNKLNENNKIYKKIISINYYMSTVENDNKTFRCDTCNKNYKDKSGIWYHNNKYHSSENISNSSKSSSFSTFPSSKSSILFSNEKSSKITL